MKNLLTPTLFAVLATTSVMAQDFKPVFLPVNASTVVTLNQKDAICVYLMNGYRPITESAVLAVKTIGAKSCNDKAEAYLFNKTGKKFKRYNKTKLGEVRYEKIKTQYYEWLASQR